VAEHCTIYVTLLQVQHTVEFKYVLWT